MIEKAAKARSRSPRKDPDQEAIVRSKDAINERTSKLIRLLIELKRGWNGNPAPDVGVSQKYNLTQPMPDEVVGAGDAALQELTSIIQGLHQIDNMQDTYSATRTQRISERMKQMQELQQQTEAAEQVGLRKEASSRLSRLWSYVVAPFSTEQGKWERIRLLKALARINNNLKDVDEAVLSGDPAILDALFLAKQLYLDAKGSFFEDFRKSLNNMIRTTLFELERLEKQLKIEKAKHRERERTGPQPTPQPGKGGIPVPSPKKTKEKADAESDKEKALTQLGKRLQEAQAELSKSLERERALDKQRALDNLQSNLSTGQGQIPVEDALRSGVDKPGKTKPSKPKAVVPEPEPEVPELDVPPPPEPPDPRQRQIAIRNFIMTDAKETYLEEARNLSSYRGAPEPWGSRIRDQWVAVNSAAEDVRADLPLNTLSMNYLTFIKAVGDFKATAQALKDEMLAYQKDNSFEFGSTKDETQLENQARQFVRSRYEKFASSEDVPIIVQGSGLSRWVRRTLTELSWKRDKHLRLQVDRQIRDALKGLQPLMDNLEKRNINFRQLINQSGNFYDSFIQVYDKLADLAESYNARMRIQKSEHKVEKKRMKYDLIPNADINAMRNISKMLKADRFNINELDKIETGVSRLQAVLEKFNETGVLVDSGKEESKAQSKQIGEM